MSVYFSFRVGRSGTSGANMRYITRETAIGAEREALYIQNYPEYAREGETYDELRSNLIAYADQQEQDELEMTDGGRGDPQTHFRAIASCEREVPTEQALEMAQDYLESRFPDARAVAAVHQDRDHTHVHFHIQTRDVDDERLRFSREEWQTLDMEWARIYAREFGQEQAREHQEKKEETRAYKQEYARAKAEGREPEMEKPERASRRHSPEQLREEELRNYGIDEARSGEDQREASDRESPATSGERAINEYLEQCDRTTEAGRGALQEASRLGDRELSRGLDRGDR